MLLTPEEEQTLNFYLWELGGRGWDLFGSEVELEPAFRPYALEPTVLRELDNGKPLDVFLRSFGEGIVQGWKSRTPGTFLNGVRSDRRISDKSAPIVISVRIGSDDEIAVPQVEQFLTTLSDTARPIGFELVGTADAIRMQLPCFEPDCEMVERQIHAQFPSIVTARGEDSLHSAWNVDSARAVIDFGLEEEFMRPLRCLKSLDHDPLAAVVGALEGCSGEELGVLQILFRSARNPWAKSIVRSVTDARGNPLMPESDDMVSLAREKVRYPLFACVVRVAAQASSVQRAKELAKHLASSLRTVARPGSNSLIPLSRGGADAALGGSDVVTRRSHRAGMLLNSMELVTLVHPLAPSVWSTKLGRDIRKSAALPDIAAHHSFVLGENLHRGVINEASLDTGMRLRHVHIIGRTGTGKSTLIAAMVRQDMEAGRGVAVLDPHGDLIDRIVELVPDERLGDTILFDPSDPGYPVGFNILEARSEMERTVLSSDLVDLFRRFSTSWGDQMSTVLSNAIHAILECGSEGTLIELKRFLLEKDFRAAILRDGVDAHTVYFWEKEFPILKGSSQVSIITRLDAFLRSKLMRTIVCRRNGIQFGNIVNDGKILLAKLSEGIIGEENAHLLGSLICSKLHQVVMSRQAVVVEKRRPFFCYVDEFQRFATPSMASMLSGSRKYGFGLVLAHQDLQQIGDTALANSVISNPATRICFALGDHDAQKLAAGFSHFNASDLMNQGVGEAIVRVDRSEFDFNLTTHELSSAAPEVASERREKLATLTQERFAQTIPQVDSGVSSNQESGASPVSPGAGSARSEQVLKQSDVRPISKVAPPQEKSPGSSDERTKRNALTQHRYLQTLIKKMAEQRGFRAVIEEPTPNGSGKVDVGLERDGKKFAVEISVTTDAEHEIHNIEKCLEAGYETVIACSPEAKNLTALKKLIIEALPMGKQERVRVFEPDELFLFLDQEVASASDSEERVKGYRVKVQYQAISDAEKSKRREAVGQVIAQAMRRMKGKQ